MMSFQERPALLGAADYRWLLSDVGERTAFVNSLCERVLASDAEVIVSATTRSMIFATLACDRLRMPMAYLRPKPKEHGKQRQFEGRLPAKGARVAILFDDPPTSAELDRAATTVAQNHGVVSDVVVLVERPQERERSPGQPTLKQVQRLGAASLRFGGGTWDSNVRATQVADALLDVGAVTIAPAGRPYEFVSKLLSPIYTDNRLLISNPQEWAVIVDALVGTIQHTLGGDIDVVAGVVTSGLPHAAEVAERLRLPIVYTNADEPDAEHLPTMEGSLDSGQKVLLIEDHVTTGKSVLAAAANIRACGGALDSCLAIFTYDSAEVEAKFRKDGIGLLALCDLPVLLEVGRARGLFGVDERDAVLEWVADPQGWTSRHESERPQKSAASK